MNTITLKELEATLWWYILTFIIYSHMGKTKNEEQ